MRDASGPGKPRQWARRVVLLYGLLEADCVVAEKNFGGDMVAATIHAVDPSIPVKMVTASRGKAVRAEPMAALYGSCWVGGWGWSCGMCSRANIESLRFCGLRRSLSILARVLLVRCGRVRILNLRALAAYIAARMWGIEGK